MPRRTSSHPPTGGARRVGKADPVGLDRIIDMDVDQEMRSSFLEYAYSVI
ncbi:MAG: hypothetical protein ACKOFP_02665 [Actinomycetota bacterium]